MGWSGLENLEKRLMLDAATVTVDYVTTNDVSPALTGTVSDPDATVVVRVDGTSYTAVDVLGNTWELPAGQLGAGAIPDLVAGFRYDVEATAINPDGVGQDTTTRELYVADENVNDVTAPVVNLDVPGTTNDPLPVLTGDVADNIDVDKVEVTVNGNTYEATLTQTGPGAYDWEVQVTDALPDGIYDVDVTATDTSGNTGTDLGQQVAVDLTNPTVTVDALTTNDATPTLTGTATDLTWGGVIIVDVNGVQYDQGTAPPVLVTDNGDGTWDWELTIPPGGALPDGTYDVEVEFFDDMFNTGHDATLDELTVENNQLFVDMNMTAGQDSLHTNDTTPVLTGNVGHNDTDITVTINGVDYAATNNLNGTWTLNVPDALTDGQQYDVTITTEDDQHNTYQRVYTAGLTIDETDPMADVDPLLTNDTTPVITGTYSDNFVEIAALKIEVNAVEYAADWFTGGEWQATVTNVLPDNTYDVLVTVTDLGANQVGYNRIDKLTVDTDVPVVTTDALDTADNTPALTGTVGAGNPDALIIVTVNGVDYMAVNNGDDTWTLPDNDITPPLPDGIHPARAVGLDPAGNLDVEEAGGPVNVDTTAPTVTLDDVVGGAAITGLTEDPRPELTGVITDPNFDAITVTVGGNDYTAAAADITIVDNGDGTFDWTLPTGKYVADLPDGPVDVSIVVADDMPNPNESTTPFDDAFVVDTTAPVVAVFDGNPVTTGDLTPWVWGTVDDPDATIGVNVIDNPPVVFNHNYVGVNNGDGTWTALVTDALTNGTSYDVTVTGTDPAGNPGVTALANGLVADTGEPAVSVDWLWTSNLNPALSGTFVKDAGAEDIDRVQIIVLDAADVQVGSFDSDLNPAWFDIDNVALTWGLEAQHFPQALAEGVYDVQVTVTDAGADTATDTSMGELIIDLTDPTATLDLTEGYAAFVTGDATPPLTGTVSEVVEADTVQVQIGASVWYDAAVAPDLTWLLADNVAAQLGPGAHDVQVKMTDLAGRENTDTFADGLYVDLTPPVITVPVRNTDLSTPTLTGTVTDDFAVKQVDITVDPAGLNLLYADVDVVGNAWSVTIPEADKLPEGTYEVQAEAWDQVNNKGQDTTADELTIDLDVPQVTVAELVTNDTTPEVTGTVNNAQAAIEITVDGNDYAGTNNGDGTWSATVTGALAEGVYDVIVTATVDAKVGNDQTVNELTIDLTAPTVTMDAKAPTADNTPTLSGTVSDSDSNVVITVDGNPYIAVVDENGDWEATVTDNLDDGIYVVDVAATDQAGNVGTAQGEVTIDTQAPVVTVNTLTTNDSTPTLSGTVVDLTLVGVQVTVGGHVYAATITNGTWTADVTDALADGVYDVQAEGTDQIGFTGQDATINELTVDSISPVVTVTPLVTNDATPTVAGTVTAGPGFTIVTVTVTVDGVDYAATIVGNDWTADVTNALAEATYDVVAVAEDDQAHTGQDQTADELTVDLTAPVVTVQDAATNDTTPDLAGTVDDATAAVVVTVNGVDYNAVNDGVGGWTVTVTDVLPDNTYVVDVAATDPAGNAGTAAGSLVVDTVAPVVTVNALNTNDTTPLLSGTVDDPDAAIVVTVNAVDYNGVNDGAGGWTAQVTDVLALGVYEVAAVATDAVGNVGTDATADELTIQVNPDVSVAPLVTNDTTPTVSGTAVAAEGAAIVSVTVTVNGVDYAATLVGNDWTADVTNALPEGTYDVTAVALDDQANTGQDPTAGELTIDLTAPVVTVDALATADNTPTLTGTVDDATAAIVVTVNGVDYNGVNAGATWTAEVADVLADGVYEVAATATDPAGNPGTDGTSDELTVDTTAPVVAVDTLQTHDTTPTVTGTVTDLTAVTVEVLVVAPDLTEFGPYAATVVGDTWSADVTDDLGDGAAVSFDVQATATDAVANVGTDATTDELTIDPNSPAVAIDGVPITTEDPTPTLTGTYSSPVAAAIDSIRVSVGGFDYAAAFGGGVWTATIIDALGVGTYEVVVTAEDDVGRVGNDDTADELTIEEMSTELVTLDADTKKITYFDADGSEVTIKYSGKKDVGEVDVLFRGIYVDSLQDGKNVEVWSLEDSLRLESIEIIGDTKSLSIKAKGGADDAMQLDGLIFGDAELRKLSGKDVTLAGAGIDMDGVIRYVKLGSVQADIIMNGIYDKGVKFKIYDQVFGAQIRLANSDIKSFTTGSLIETNVFVGVDPAVAGLPDDAADFLAPGLIKKLKVKDNYIASNVAASELGKLTLENVETDNGGIDFGVAGETLKKLKVKQPEDTLKYGKDEWWAYDWEDFMVNIV